MRDGKRVNRGRKKANVREGERKGQGKKKDREEKRMRQI